MIDETSSLPLIITFVSDLLFGVKIDNVAQQLGYQIETISSASDLGDAVPGIEKKPGEGLFGRLSELMAQLSRRQPALLIFDLSNETIPWQEWIPALKSSPATRAIPILCFGAHVEAKTLKQARSFGADLVVPRSSFSADMPRLITDLAISPDFEAAQEACRQPIAQQALEGIVLLNSGEFFDAHEELEHAWMDDESAGRDLYRAILQIAVAYLQIERKNYNGAVKMLLRVRKWLAPLPDRCRGVDVARLREDTNVLHDALLELGPENMEAFDWNLRRPVIVKNGAEH
jgi:hypothetical protein